MTKEDLERVLETGREKLHEDITEKGFDHFSWIQLTNLFTIRGHIEEVIMAIEHCTQCNGGCKECKNLKIKK